MNLKQIAEHLGATLECFSGTQKQFEEMEVGGIAALDKAKAGQISFLSNPKYASSVKTTSAAAVLVSDKFQTLPTEKTAALRTKDPHLAYAKAIELFYHSPRYPPGIHSTAVIDHSAKMGRNAHIGAYVVIGANVTIGNHAVILPHVVIYEGARIGDNFFAHAHVVVREHCKLGNNVILQSGAVIGSDGYGFARAEDGSHYKILQSGTAVIGDDVEVQANSCIDRASIGETRVESGAKIDNLVQVAHGCVIGERSLICAQVGLAGSSILGKNVIMAGQAAVAGHCSIGDGAIITAQSGTSHDIEAGKVVSGSPAFDNKQWLRAVAVFNRLPELAKAVRALSDKKKDGAVST